MRKELCERGKRGMMSNYVVSLLLQGGYSTVEVVFFVWRSKTIERCWDVGRKRKEKDVTEWAKGRIGEWCGLWTVLWCCRGVTRGRV